MEEILMLKNVSVFYGEHPVLKDVNMGIRPGRILAVMGPSGSGKTTLLRALNGLLWEEPEAEMKGEICLLGRDTRTMDREELRRRVGLVFQTPQPFPFPFIKYDLCSQILWDPEEGAAGGDRKGEAYDGGPV